MLLQRPLDRRPFERTERGFPVVHEDVGDLLAGADLDVGVGVTERHTESSRDCGADGRLAGAGRADQDQDRAGHRMVSEAR